ncbi:MAG TPA: endonuclease/exonuclease/phosphatase family protein [Acidimicrobiales bacterium]
MSRLVVASLNIHWGQDGRALDVLDADLVLLQEVWAAAGEDPLAEAARARGYEVSRAVLVERADLVGRRLDVARARVPGTWGLAVLHRAGPARQRVVPLGHAPADAERAVQVVDLPHGGETVRVANLHLTHRFPLALGQLRRALEATAAGDGDRPTVVAGDANLPRRLVRPGPGLAPAVRGATFPSGRPVVQFDHVLVSRHWAVESATITPDVGSDHRGVRAVLRRTDV